MIKTLVIDKHDQNITMIKNDLARYYLNDLKNGTYIITRRCQILKKYSTHHLCFFFILLTLGFLLEVKKARSKKGISKLIQRILRLFLKVRIFSEGGKNLKKYSTSF